MPFFSLSLKCPQAVITSIAALKRRSPPDSLSHPSVGTEGDLQAREELRKISKSIHLTRSHLDPLVLTLEDLQQWGYIVEVPEGPGGDRPHEEGGVKPCVRCSQMFVVNKIVDAEECNYHWGRPLTTTVQGKFAPKASRNLYDCLMARRKDSHILLLLKTYIRAQRLCSWTSRLL
jgi:RNA exonuclease 1